MEKCTETVNWDFFWKRVEKHPLFLRFLYFIHMKKYFKLLDPLKLEQINILELGAGTGSISYELNKRYGGTATLVDNNPAALTLHHKLIKDKKNLQYLDTDFFKTELPRQYDLVFSDGLLEHFPDKGIIIDLHKKFVKPGGWILFFALQRNFFNSFLALGEKKMGYSEPIAFKECITLFEKKGLKVCGTVSYFFEYGILGKSV